MSDRTSTAINDNPDEAVIDRVREALHAWLDEQIEWHPPFGATSEEQWEIDTERAFVQSMKRDDALVARLVTAATDDDVTARVTGRHGWTEALSLEFGAEAISLITLLLTTPGVELLPNEQERLDALIATFLDARDGGSTDESRTT